MSMTHAFRPALISLTVAVLMSGAPARAGQLVDLIDTLNPPSMPGAPASVVYGQMSFAECFTDWMTFDPTELGPVEVLSRTEEHDLAIGTMSAMMVALASNSGRRMVLQIECGSGVAIVSVRFD